MRWPRWCFDVLSYQNGTPVITRHKTGRQVGAANTQAKLGPSQVLEIFLSNEKPDYLAAVYHVDPSAIYRIKTRKTWRHLTKGLASNDYDRNRNTTTKGTSK